MCKINTPGIIPSKFQNMRDIVHLKPNVTITTSSLNTGVSYKQCLQISEKQHQYENRRNYFLIMKLKVMLKFLWRR